MQIYAFFPIKRIINPKTAKANRKATHDGNPSAVGNTPTNSATEPTVKAYGIWVLTCCRWSQPLDRELMMVVSEIGEQWSPMTAPAITEATTL